MSWAYDASDRGNPSVTVEFLWPSPLSSYSYTHFTRTTAHLVIDLPLGCSLSSLLLQSTRSHKQYPSAHTGATGTKHWPVGLPARLLTGQTRVPIS